MKKFFKKLLIFVTIITTITMSLNYTYVKRYKDANKFTSIPDTIQICNFGSSHGQLSYNYEDFDQDYNCFNFGLTEQTLSYDYRLFQYFGNHIHDGTVVFITVSYFSLFGKEEVSRATFESKNKRYYSILPASLIKEYDFQTDMLIRYVPILASSGRTGGGMSLGSDEKTWQRVATDIDVVENAKADYTTQIGRLYDNGILQENQEEIDALYALIKGCQAKGAIPVLITTPYLHEYTDEIKKNSADLYDRFYSIIDQVVKNTGAEYYNYAFDERFENKYSWFIDSGHLNKEGAKAFVNILMHEIVYAKGYF